MCGIAGAIDASRYRAAVRVRLINDAQRHRGPDHGALAHVSGFTLGNTRLAIQDPGPAGNQPFASADGRYHCVFNGEIYNHRELVRRHGLAVRTKCDGEVIPALWSKLGLASLAELRGMFAIAVVDSLEERLYLARDPFGIKPLHWRVLPDGLLFASEIRPLIQMGVGVRIYPQAIARYLHLGATAADQAPFSEITALPPNSVASFNRDCHSTIRPIQADGPLQAAAHADLEKALTESVELHLAADVPSALLLSAGVDSATIAAVGRRLGRDLHCLTVATEDSADESETAAETARHYGHRFQRVPAVVTADDVQSFFTAMQRPSIDGLNNYVVCRAVHEAGFKVALSGLGGDEAVGGYSHFRLLPYLSALRALDTLPSQVNGAAAKALARLGLAGETKLKRLLASDGPRDGWELVHLQREVLPEALVTELTGVSCHDSVGAPARSKLRPGQFAAMVAAEVALYLQATLLPDADAFSMVSSVELRVPFVDCEVLSASLRLADENGRRPGKKAAGRALHDAYLLHLATTPKRGFSLPMQRWMSGPLSPVLKAADDPTAAIWSVLDREAAERAGLLPLRPGRRWSEAWTLAALNGWLETI